MFYILHSRTYKDIVIALFPYYHFDHIFITTYGITYGIRITNRKAYFQ